MMFVWRKERDDRDEEVMDNSEIYFWSFPFRNIPGNLGTFSGFLLHFLEILRLI